MIMKYDERACKFNMDNGCVELLLRDGRKISIDCTGVEDELDVTMAQRTELDYLIYNDPLGYADLILNGDTKEYLKNAAGSHGLEGYPDEAIKTLARCFYPSMVEFFNSEEGQREYEEWLKEQEALQALPVAA